MVKANLGKEALLKIHDGSSETTLDFSDCFTQIVIKFIKTNEDAYVLLDTVVLTCVLTEAIIKEKLREINPALILKEIDPVSIAIITNKKGKLVQELRKRDVDIQSASISILLDRFLSFYDKKQYRSSILNFFKIRNSIVHSAKQQTINERQVAILITKYIFPFINEYVSISDDLWKKVIRLQKFAHDKFKTELSRKIVVYEKKASLIRKEEKEKFILQLPYLGSDESIAEKNFICPACGFKSTFLITGVDFDGGPEGVEVYGYSKTECVVCDLELEEIEYKEISINAEDYFGNSDDVEEWVIATEPEDYSDVDWDWEDYEKAGVI